MRWCLVLLPMVIAFPCLTAQDCNNGQAGAYQCGNVSLSSRLSASQMGGTRGNDIWGWQDGSREYAIVGLDNGTAFVDVSSASNPRVIGHLPTATSNSSWRDIKVYADHAFIVSEAGGHGMQVFDLTRLRGASTGTSFTADTTLTDLGNGDMLGNSHNIVMDFNRGIAFTVGTNLASGGLVAIDVSTPKEPVFMGYFSADGYTHDAQIIRKGSNYYALACNENSVTVINTTNASNMTLVDRVGISGSRYIHQGWTSPDQNYFLVNDELDEIRNGHNTRTHIFDISNINNPQYVDYYEANTTASDHNLYTMGSHVFQANYRAGLQIFEMTNLAQAELTRVGFFDNVTSGDEAGTSGAWSVYPYFGIDKILVSNISEGLFILDYNGNELVLPVLLSQFTAVEQEGRAYLQWTTESEQDNQYWEVERSFDGETFEVIGKLPGEGTSSTPSDYSFIDAKAKPGINFYRLKQVDIDGQSTHSDIRSINVNPQLIKSTIYPTVLQPGGKLNWKLPHDSGTLQIFTLTGKMVLQQKISQHFGKINLNSLAQGQYVVRIDAPNSSISQKIIIAP